MRFEEKAGAGMADGIRAEAASREGEHRHLRIRQELGTAEEPPFPARFGRSAPPGRAARGGGQRARAERGLWGSGRGRAATVSGGRGLREVLPVFLALPLNSSSAGVSHCLEMEWAGVCV